jgi:hypothetical protein
MLTSVERNAVQAFSKGNNFLPHCVGVLVSIMFTRPMLSFMC